MNSWNYDRKIFLRLTTQTHTALIMGRYLLLFLVVALTDTSVAAGNGESVGVVAQTAPASSNIGSEVEKPVSTQSDITAQAGEAKTRLITDGDPSTPVVRKKKRALPKARNIDLTKPVEPPAPLSSSDILPTESSPGEPGDEDISDSSVAEPGISEESEEIGGASLILLGTEVPPSTTSRLSWSPEQTFESIAVPTPVLVVNGAKPGPVLCLTGAIHGDEINGVEIIRQVLYGLDPAKVSGSVIGVPIVNQLGFRRNSRYLPDRRDLNRYFPGRPTGSSASRIAYSFFNEVIRHCHALVDLHTGSFHRTNLTQLRADLRNSGVAQLSQNFGGMVVLHRNAQRGTLRNEAVRAGIPSVTLEAGEPMRIQKKVVTDGVNRIRTLLDNMGIYYRPFSWGKPEPVYYKSRWVRAEQGGFLISNITLGSTVEKGDLLGKVVDPITNVETQIHSPVNGRVLGMALNQVVMPGFAAYHLGISATQKDVVTPEEETPDSGDSETKPIDADDLGAEPLDIDDPEAEPLDTDDFGEE